MEWMIASFALGFLGSIHCIGMCGPIALALPLPEHHFRAKLSGILLYNGGRILTYSIFGALFGLVGKGFIIAGYQQILSITLGFLLLLAVIAPERYFSKFGITAFLLAPISKLKSHLADLFRQRSYQALLIIGILNGLLPCGLVYLGVAGAIATGSPWQGSLFMMLFGMGTLPAMTFISLSSQKIGSGWRNKIRKAVPSFIIMMACILILRGMNLGIPYISPELSKTDCTQHQCCHKNK